MQVNTLIHARWIIPVEPDDRVLEHHSLAIKDGRIVAIIPSQEAREQYQADTTIELNDHALIPGLINAHTHAAMNLLRGLADDLPLMDWLNKHIWPAESRWVNEEFVLDGSELAIAEMLRSGTTCFNDMYFFPNITARVAAQAGIRAMVGLIVLDFPTIWAEDADQYIEKGLQVFDQYKDDNLIHTAFAPHAPYTVSDQPLQRIQTLADELNIPLHIHLHETISEIQHSLEHYQQRPLARLQQLGLVSPQLIAVHMTQLEEDEITLMTDYQAHVVHCPESNLKLASGFCPLQKLIKAGVNVALGTDGAASNNDLDMLSEMRSAALLAKGVANDASAVPAHQALRMATINGARALGLDQEIGSLECGKWADITAIQLDDIETGPVYNPISQLVYAASRDKVSDVWVNGKHLLKERQLTTLNSDKIIHKARAWRDKIAQ
ncbi:MAG: TRZ/ATZ family hydrolase [Gammaproteobacteria bacterium]|nr:TRZ/ATZ family hydrolase [Gammaproteobacteria bacterium]